MAIEMTSAFSRRDFCVLLAEVMDRSIPFLILNASIIHKQISSPKYLTANSVNCAFYRRIDERTWQAFHKHKDYMYIKCIGSSKNFQKGYNTYYIANFYLAVEVTFIIAKFVLRYFADRLIAGL